MKIQLQNRTTNEYLGMPKDAKAVTLYFREYNGEGDSTMGSVNSMGYGLTMSVTIEEANGFELGGVYDVGLTTSA